MDDILIVNPAELAEDERRWAKTGEHGLDEIEPDEGGQEQPEGMNPISEGDPEQGDGAGEQADEVVGGHGECN